MNKDELFSQIDSIFDEIVEIRRILHSFPELSFKEYKTTEFIQNYLSSNEIENFRITETGVIGILGNKNNSESIAFRADIDALPIVEETNLPFASRNDGVMHACGHDFHTSILLGAAKILKKFEDDLPIPIKLIFQPAEEKLPGGAKEFIDKGVLQNPKVISVFGEHIEPEIEVGSIAVSSGTIMASADELYWTVQGKGSHAAQPHLGSDPIRASIFLSHSLYDLPNRVKDPLEPMVLAITSINGGNATNIYPQTVKLMGTLRTFNENIRGDVISKIKELSHSISNIFGVNVEFSPLLGYPPLVNDPMLVDFVKKIASQILPEGEILNFKPKMWAEDFAYYSQKLPSVFWFLGAKPKGFSGEVFGLHSSKFNPDEQAIKFGVAMFIKIGLTFNLT